MSTDLRVLEAADPEAARRFRGDVRRLLRDLDTLDAQGVAELARRTRELRRRLLDELVGTGSWSAYHLPQLLQGVERAVQEWSVGAGAHAADLVRQGFELGGELGGAFSVAAGAPSGGFLVTSDTIEALRRATAELVVDVGDRVRRRINQEVRTAALGLQRPHEAISEVARHVTGIRQPIRGAGGKVIGHRYVGPMARAETIVRTELNRAFSFGADERLRRVAEVIPEMQREWVATRDSRTRPAHRRAHGQVRAVDEPFRLTRPAARLRFPRDPSAPAGHVINCRCVALPRLPDWPAAPPLERST